MPYLISPHLAAKLYNDVFSQPPDIAQYAFTFMAEIGDAPYTVYARPKAPPDPQVERHPQALVNAACFLEWWASLLREQAANVRPIYTNPSG